MDFPLIPTRLRRSAAALVAAAALAGALAACGGGSQAEPFRPARLFALGDQSSVLTAQGRKYTVNALKTDGALDCVAHPLWTQSVARAFGLVFAECNPDAVAAPTAQTLAVPGAQVAFEGGAGGSTLVAQVDALLAAAPGEDALVTLLVGANDVVEQYARFPATPEADLAALLRERGKAAAAQVNRIALAGPAVLLATVPDLGLTPFALAEKAAHTDTDRAALLTRLVDAFNAGMRLEMINDGRLIGVVFADQEVRDIVRNPPVYGFSNATGPACLASAPLPDCTTGTLVTGGSATAFLWADGLHLSAGGQARLGLLAQIRAQNNPF